jgi:hypothetical protein
VGAGIFDKLPDSPEAADAQIPDTRRAMDNEELVIDSFRRRGEVAEYLWEKGILTMEERNTLITAPINDRRRLAAPHICLCSMRRGEVRGLQWGGH